MNRLLSFTLVCLLHVSMALASTFNLTVEVTPVGAGSLNTSGGTYEEGSTVYLYAYRNTGFVFKGWYEGDQLVASSTSFNYTMPSHDAKLQARYEYDPEVPGNPAMPDTTTFYNLSASISPTGAGSLSTTNGRYAAGARIYMYAYRNTGYKFLCWQDDQGEKVSESLSFDYTMPRRDVHLTALFEFDPDVPANPDSMATLYTVTLRCKPMGGGSFNTNQATAEEGANVRLYSYSNTGYKFLRWEDSKGNVLSTERDFYYVMPHGNTEIYGVFDFDPEVPSNPAKNYWNKELGEVIVDDFTPNSLNSAVRNAIGESSTSEVAMITVAGRMGNNDFGIANNYENCTLLDLSRVTGITEIPSYAFDYSKIENIYLPASVEKIGYRAFYQCEQLTAVNLYAMTPPTLENQVFDGVPDGLVVYVPAAAIAQYQADEAWSRFTLMPIQEDIRNLTVFLPEGTAVADYAGMWLELTNAKNGQHMHYVMTDRLSYTFANIIRNTEWNVVLRSQAGDVFGEIGNVKVEDDDVTVTFASLTRPQNVTLKVMAADKDVTGQVQVAWTDTAGNYVAQGTSLSGLPVGRQVAYRISLSQELAMTYQTPQAQAYTLQDGDNALVCQLEAIPQTTISGLVKDYQTGQPLVGATVSASQTFDGRYGRTLNTKTDAEGRYQLSMSRVPTQLAVAAQDYVSQTLTIDQLLTAESASVPDVALKGIVGATVGISFTFTSSVAEGQKAEVQEWYSDYQNVNFAIRNLTKQCEIGQFSVQYPQIVLLEEVADGDELSITASSRTSAFKPVTVVCTVSEQRAAAKFPIVELGRIEASFQQNANRSVVGMLYDKDGKLLKTATYTNALLAFAGLADGAYTLVTMGSSRLFNTIYDLSQLPETGLTLGTDYVQHAVDVESGAISLVRIEQVPTLDESKLYYTGEGTSFAVNKSSIVAGNYLTLTGRIDFKTAYASEVSNVQMIVDLPESCSFVENSVMVGNTTSSYTLNGTRLTIPLVRYTDRVRFCVIPTLGGNYAPSAFAQFDLNGQSIIQPIGSANYTAKDLSINVPSTVAKTTIPVSGTAIGKSTIEIYDNEVLIGQTTSLANGIWATTCELDEPYNLSLHKIMAKVTTSQGIVLQSENKECFYDKNAVQVSKVMMYHENPEMHKSFALTFDFQKPLDKEENYIYYIYNKKFTFTIDFTDNSPEKLSNVILYVKTAKSGWHPLTATYDAKQDIWVAAGEFGNMYDGDLPVNVSVDYTLNGITATVDYAEIADIYNTSANMRSGLNAIQETYDAYSERLAALHANSTPATSEVNELFNALGREFGMGSSDEEVNRLLQQYKEMSKEEWTAFRDSVLSASATPDDLEILKYYEEGKDLLEDYIYDFMVQDIPFKVTRHACNGIEPSALKADGFMPLSTSEGNTIYVKGDISSLEIVDFTANTYSKIEIVGSNVSSDARRVSFTGMWEAAMKKIDECNTMLVQAQTIALDAVTEIASYFGAKIAELSKTANMYRAMAQLDRQAGLLEGSSELLESANRLEQQAMELEAKIAKYQKWTADARVAGKAIVGKAVQLLGSLATLSIDVKNWWNLHKQIEGKLPCKGNEAYAEELNSDVNYYGGLICTGDLITFAGAVFGVYSAAMGLAGTPLSGGLSTVIGGVGGLIGTGVSIVAGLTFSWVSSYNYKRLKKAVDSLKCKEQPDPEPDPTPDNPGQPSGNPDKKFGIDPSGFVYEGVFSNRVQGATATVFYKETVEDMYGDLHENIVKWDAEEYAQENPLFTDENGYYRWDVPQGLWQVKFEKEGYETTYSEWLPVPPPQLDVNIAMKQNVQPTVRQARAYEDAVELEFDKYMMPDGLTTENIIVLQDGEPVEGSIQLLNEEVSYEGATDTYASRVRFNALQPFSAREITLVVKNRVQSYAGIRMQDDYMQAFAVELEVKQIVCDSVSVVAYGQTSALQISVLPALASAGRTLSVTASSDLMLSLENESVTIGEDGTAIIVFTGQLPGTAALTFTVSDSELSATSIVSIEQRPYLAVDMPTASIASGSAVDKGTEIYLSCQTEGAVIYYTLDGSCPCDENAQRYVYDGTPIVVTDSVTIRVMAVCEGMIDSDIAEFTYTVNHENAIGDVALNGQLRIYPLPVRDKLNVTAGGSLIRSVSLHAVSGALVKRASAPGRHVVLDTGSLAPGVYTVTVVTENQTMSRKVVKQND